MRNKKVVIYHSQILKRIVEEMGKDPWYVKLKRHIKIQIWVWICITRKYWDKNFENYIFKKK